MKLKEYLSNNNFTQQQFVDYVEKKQNIKIPQSTLAKWVTGIRIPRKKEMELLFFITEGNVEPNDFFNIS
jgi:arginine repressor